MILADEKKQVIRSKGFQESTFKIETSSKAFNILSSKLYSDQYQAIVRELCTNASDAHVNAGIGHVPIEVHVPSYMDQSFSVRDHGNGIDPSEFEKIYTTYFYSTKTTSDTQVGCFGLGSKSPFAYTKQFTVENNYNGTKYIYSCFENENGEPSVSLVASKPTEDKGVKVSFSVKTGDSSQFRKAAVRVLSWFDVKPKCNEDIAVKSLVEKYKGNKFFTFKKEDGFDKYEHTNDYSANIFIRMGQVIYPCESEILRDMFSGNTTTVINANIGDVDITPSRESLEYRSKTNGFLESIKAEFLKDISKNYEDILNSKDKTEFQKFKLVVKQFNDTGISRKLSKNVFTNYPTIYDGTVYFKELPYGKFPNGVSYAKYDRWRDRVETYTIGNHGSVRIDETTIIVLKDKNINLKAKLKKLLKENDDRNNFQLIIVIIDIADKDLLMNEYGLEESDYLLASNLDYDKQAGTSRVSNSNNCTAMTYTVNGADRKGTKLSKDTNEGFYLKDSEYYKLDPHSINNSKVIGDKTVYIFTDNQFNSLKINERNFVNFLDYLVNEIKTNKDEIVRMLSEDNVKSDMQWQALAKIHENTQSETLIDDYIKEYSDFSVDYTKVGYYEAITNIIRRHDEDLYDEIASEIRKRDNKHSEAQNKIKEKYPLLKVLIDNRDFDGIIKQVAEYVDLVSTTIQKDGEV